MSDLEKLKQRSDALGTTAEAFREHLELMFEAARAVVPKSAYVVADLILDDVDKDRVVLLDVAGDSLPEFDLEKAAAVLSFKLRP